MPPASREREYSCARVLAWFYSLFLRKTFPEDASAKSQTKTKGNSIPASWRQCDVMDGLLSMILATMTWKTCLCWWLQVTYLAVCCLNVLSFSRVQTSKSILNFLFLVLRTSKPKVAGSLPPPPPTVKQTFQLARCGQNQRQHHKHISKSMVFDCR
jgi:hypothetical protein